MTEQDKKLFDFDHKIPKILIGGNDFFSLLYFYMMTLYI